MYFKEKIEQDGDILQSEKVIEKAQKEFNEARQKETLPAIKVKNTAIWANPAFENAPLKIQPGHSTDLGLFLTPHPEKYPDEKVENGVIMPEKISGRSILFSSTPFRDSEGRLYRDVDLKGIGAFLRMPDGTYVVGEVKKRSLDPNQAKGLLDYDVALTDKECTEMFLSKGLRTHRVVAILDIEEIIDKEGNKISIAGAKERGIISQEMRPVIAVRAFGTKERLDYMHVPSERETERVRAILALNDAIALVALELHKKSSEFSMQDYLEWFAQTLGNQVARIRNFGAYHGHLHLQNITLDCRITDLEGILAVKKIFSTTSTQADLKKHLREKELTPEIIYRSEFEGTKKSLDDFLHDVEKLTGAISQEDIQKYLHIFEKEYNDELKQGVN